MCLPVLVFILFATQYLQLELVFFGLEHSGGFCGMDKLAWLQFFLVSKHLLYYPSYEVVFLLDSIVCATNISCSFYCLCCKTNSLFYWLFGGFVPLVSSGQRSLLCVLSSFPSSRPFLPFILRAVVVSDKGLSTELYCSSPLANFKISVINQVGQCIPVETLAGRSLILSLTAAGQQSKSFD